MQKNISALFVAGLVLLPALLFAQFNNNTTSPFSRYGLGDLHDHTHGRTSAMGGATLGSRNAQQINFSNPASYTSTDSLAFLFEFGFNGKFSSYKNDLNSFSANDVNFRYFSMSFPISNSVSTALGLTPFSDIGYDVQVNQNLDYAGQVQHVYFGEGSLSRAFLGLAIEPFRNVSVGANLFYLFGNLTRNASITFPENSYMYTIQKNNGLRLRDFGMNFGIQATLPMKDNQSLTIGATIETKQNFTGFNSDISYKTLVLYDSSGNPIGDSDTLSFKAEVKDRIVMPMVYGVGLSYVKKDKLEINADYHFQAWSEATAFGEPFQFITDRQILALGGEFIPDRYSIRSYTSRIAYRAGLSYENSYLIINNQQVKDFGISFGVGLPVYRSNSTVNISAEIGRRGSMEKNLLHENYMKLNFSVNLYDLWFIKRRFD